MNDRYLFKAKTCSGEWVTGLLAHRDNKYYISNKAGMPFAYEVRPDSICQCKGLTDKNGNLIWKNDICKYYNSEDGENIAVIEEDCAKWIKGNLSKNNIMTPLFYLQCSDEWEVIGNIFDNPELLEMEQEEERENE